MLINGDAKSLELCVAAFLAQDRVMSAEIIDGIDLHSLNRDIFKLPPGKEGRQLAKIAVFRILYGGTEYAFGKDPDFEGVSKSVEYWRRVIETFYEKYKGIAKWHKTLVQEATFTGKLVMPHGRQFSFQPYKTDRGEIKWPRTQILNFPVQSFGADLMSVARILFAKKFYGEEVRGKLIATVHDSIVCDVEEQETERVCMMLIKSFNEVPAELFKRFGISYTLPFNAEVQYGLNLKNMTEFK